MSLAFSRASGFPGALLFCLFVSVGLTTLALVPYIVSCQTERQTENNRRTQGKSANQQS
nr:MAG TPA: hypothetical protein [Caudoviricetes sp.]